MAESTDLRRYPEEAGNRRLLLGLRSSAARFASLEFPLAQFLVPALPVSHRLAGGLLFMINHVLVLWNSWLLDSSPLIPYHGPVRGRVAT